jgi:hypothetical protein
MQSAEGPAQIMRRPALNLRLGIVSSYLLTEVLTIASMDNIGRHGKRHLRFLAHFYQPNCEGDCVLAVRAIDT